PLRLAPNIPNCPLNRRLSHRMAADRLKTLRYVPRMVQRRMQEAGDQKIFHHMPGSADRLFGVPGERERTALSPTDPTALILHFHQDQLSVGHRGQTVGKGCFHPHLNLMESDLMNDQRRAHSPWEAQRASSRRRSLLDAFLGSSFTG